MIPDNPEKKYFSTSEVARFTEVKAHNVRKWREEFKLGKKPNGIWKYDLHDMVFIQLVGDMRKSGLEMERVRKIIRLKR